VSKTIKILAAAILTTSFSIAVGRESSAADANVTTCAQCVYVPAVMRDAASMSNPPQPMPTTTATSVVFDTATPLPIPTQIPAQTVTPIPTGSVFAQGVTVFKPYDGSSSDYIVGEIRNSTSSTIQYVKITAILRNDSGTVVGAEYTYAHIGLITPNSNSPFRLILSNPPAWSSADLIIEYSETADQPYVLDVSTSSAYLDAYGGWHVPVRVTNNDSSSHTYVQIFATLYGSDGKVIGVDYTYTSPSTLMPGQTVDVDMEVYFWAGRPDASRISSYSVIALDDSPGYRGEAFRSKMSSAHQIYRTMGESVIREGR
jgi:hypothetical protein